MNKRTYNLRVRAIDLLFWAFVGALAGELVHFLGVTLAGWHSDLLVGDCCSWRGGRSDFLAPSSLSSGTRIQKSKLISRSPAASR
jgi:hypothetical protein